MRDAYEAIFSYDELSADERSALHAFLDTHSELSDLFATWRSVAAELRISLDRHLPDRSLLVLYALEQEGMALTPEEAERLDASRGALDRAFAAHPSLRDVVASIRSASQDFDRAWEAAVPSSSPVRADRPARDRRRRLPVLVRGAALAVGVLVVGVLLWRDANLVIVRTGSGETEDIVFSDGTTVRLHEESRLRFRRNRDAGAITRTVALRGRAFFHIIPGSEVFTVETPTARTRAIGTSFSVQASLSQTQVVLASGQVSMSSRRWSHPVVTLRPGETSRIQGLRAPTAPAEVADMTEALRWSGYLVFHETPLRVVAEHLTRQYGTPVRVAPELESEPFNGTFAPDSLTLERTLDALALSFQARVEHDAEGALLLTR